MSLIKFPTKDNFLEIAKNKILGHDSGTFGGNSQVLRQGKEDTVWDQGGVLKDLTVNTQLYISSSNASDVGIVVVVSGWKQDFTKVNILAVTNGQNQIAFSDTIIVVEQAVVLGSTPIGDLYVAELDGTISGGVPQDVTKIQAKVIQGNNLSNNAIEIISPGKTAFVKALEYTTGKLKDIDIVLNFKPFNGIWLKAPKLHLAEAPAVLGKDTFVAFQEKTIIKINAIANDEPAQLSAFVYYTEVDNTLLE